MKAVCTAIWAAGLLLATSSALHAQKANWTFFGNLAHNHVYAKAIAAGFKRIGERTNGKLNVRYVFYGETPYKNTESLNLIKDGLTQMTEWSPALVSATYPFIGVTELPLLLPSKMGAAEAQAAIEKAWQAAGVVERVKDLLQQNGATFISRHYFQPMNFWFSSEDVTSLDAFKGRKIRTINAEFGTLITQLGASPVSMTSPEVYEALQRNVMDGVITGSANITGTKWDEVLRSAYIVNMSVPATFILVSTAALDGLAPDVKTVFEEEMKKINDELLALMPASDGETIELLKARGFKVTEASDKDYARLRELSQSKIWPAWQSKVGGESGALLESVLKSLKN